MAHFDLTHQDTPLHSFGKFHIQKGKYGKIDIVNSETQESVCQFVCRKCSFERICFSPDGKWLLVNGVYDKDPDYRYIWLVDARSGEKRYVYTEAECSIRNAVFSPDGTKILCTVVHVKRIQYSVVLLDMLTGSPLTKIKYELPQQFELTPDGKYLLAIRDESLSGYNLIEGQKFWSDTIPSRSPGNLFILNHDATSIALGYVFKNKYDVTYHQLNWELSFPGWADWDERARPHLEIFLAQHPNWEQADFDGLIVRLQDCGFGWLRPEGVKKKLAQMNRIE